MNRSPVRCHEACKKDPECLFYSYDQASRCNLFSSCQPKSKENSTINALTCPIRKFSYSKCRRGVKILIYTQKFAALTERKADLFKHHSTELRNTSQWSRFIYDSITGDNDFNFWDCYGYCINRQECDAFVFNRYETKCYLGNLATKERLFFEGPPTIQELFILSRRKFKISGQICETLFTFKLSFLSIFRAKSIFQEI